MTQEGFTKLEISLTEKAKAPETAKDTIRGAVMSLYDDKAISGKQARYLRIKLEAIHGEFHISSR